MLLGAAPAIYLGSWLIYTFSFYGSGQLLNISFGFFSLFSGFLFYKNLLNQHRFIKTTISFQIIFLIPLLFCIASITNFFITGNFSELAKFLMFLLLTFSFFLISSFSFKNIVWFQKYSIFFLIFSTILVVTIFTQFNLEHFKFLPKVTWAYVTSNNISYYSTLISALIIIADYCRFGRIRKWTLIFFLILSVIHFSKAHIFSLFISYLSAIFIRTKLKNKILVIIYIFIFLLFINFLGFDFFEKIVINLDIKPLTKIFYGFSTLPDLYRNYGFLNAFFYFIEDVGDVSRSIIYKNAIENLSYIGLVGVPPQIIETVFNGKDYHNTFFYALYEFGYLGFFSLILILLLISKDIFSEKGKASLFATIIFIYFIIRIFFISMDIFWFVIYWSIFIRMLKVSDAYYKFN